MSLLAATSRALGDLLDHDPHFAHRFSRSPFYEGNDPKAYRWYCQHKRVHRLADLIREIRDMTGTPHHEKHTHQQFTSGRELINAVKTRREEAQRFKQLAHELDAEMGDGLDQYDPELIDGVRVLWISEGIAARDETAFRHALKTAHRLRNAGQRMTDAALIDAYEHAYNIAQRVGGAGRASEMPSMRDRQTMARRVRGYATQSKNASQSGFTTSGSTTTSERKALATMGRRGGKKAAERWKDRESEYAKGQLQKLEKTHRMKKAQGRSTKGRISQMVNDQYAQTGSVPSWREISEELGVSRATVARHIAALKNTGDYPEL